MLETISNTTLLPLGLFISGLGGAVFGGVLYGRITSKVDSQSSRIAILEAKVEVLDRAAIPMAERLTRYETQMQGIFDMLKEIKEEIKEVISRNLN